MWNANGRSWRLISVSQHRREDSPWDWVNSAKKWGNSAKNAVESAANEYVGEDTVNAVKNAVGSAANKAKRAIS